MLFTDKEAVKIAEDFLEKNNLLPKDFKYCGIGRDIIQGGEKNEEIEVAKIIYFSRFINGEQVDGNSQIYVMLINDGEIIQVYSSYVKGEKKKKVNSSYVVVINNDIEELINSERSNSLSIKLILHIYEKKNFVNYIICIAYNRCSFDYIILE